MSYRVLARKYRPATLSEVEGQPQTVQALSNAFDQQRLHHAYMFSGTRGVGKTTLARIIAKCLNCETGVTSTPCGVCANCRAIDNGTFLDLIEVDGASRTKVEETRALLDEIGYQASQGTYKVYIIDEVHALSDASFQTLLKSLEEPPEHVKFVLATTDPDKVPVTVRSRCLHFALRNISVETIEQHLKSVLKQESIQFEDAAVHLLARMGQGSMRDALSLTDQAIALCGESIDEKAVIDMLGAAPLDDVSVLLGLLIQGDRAEVFKAVDQLAMSASDFSEILASLQSAVHVLSMAKAVGTQPTDSLAELVGQCDDVWLQQAYQVLLMGGRDLQYAPEPRVGFEMTLLRLFDFVPVTSSTQTNSSVRSTAQESPSSSQAPSQQPAPPADEDVNALENNSPPRASSVRRYSNRKRDEQRNITAKSDRTQNAQPANTTAGSQQTAQSPRQDQNKSAQATISDEKASVVKMFQDKFNATVTTRSKPSSTSEN